MHALSTQEWTKPVRTAPRGVAQLVWDPAGKLLVPCSSRGKYLVRRGSWLALRPIYVLPWGARVRFVVSQSQ